MRNIVLGFQCYFVYHELCALCESRLSYFFDTFNVLDVISMSLNIFVIFSYGYGCDWADERSTRSVAAVASVFLWSKLFYWMRLFDKTSYFIRMIADTFWDIRYFTLLFVAILFTFGNAMYILNYNRKMTDEELAANDLELEYMRQKIIKINQRKN